VFFCSVVIRRVRIADATLVTDISVLFPLALLLPGHDILPRRAATPRPAITTSAPRRSCLLAGGDNSPRRTDSSVLGSKRIAASLDAQRQVCNDFYGSSGFGARLSIPAGPFADRHKWETGGAMLTDPPPKRRLLTFLRSSPLRNGSMPFPGVLVSNVARFSRRAFSERSMPTVTGAVLPDRADDRGPAQAPRSDFALQLQLLYDERTSCSPTRPILGPSRLGRPQLAAYLARLRSRLIQISAILLRKAG